MPGRSNLAKQGKGSYRLLKLGKAYILFCGDKKVAVPPAVHNNGRLELHDTIVTTDEGEAYEIKERNGQITFEEIPTAGVSKALAKDGPAVKVKKGLSERTSRTDETEDLDELETGSDESPATKPDNQICVIIQAVIDAKEDTRYLLHLDQGSTIEQLFQDAAKAAKLPVDEIRLLYGGRQLQSRDIHDKKMVLLDCWIKNDSTVYLVNRQRGD